jgi:hypothetical protein
VKRLFIFKSLIHFSVLVIALSAQAERTGKDERIWDCMTDANSKQLGANEKYTVHEIAGLELIMTRLSDGQFGKLITNGSGYYVTPMDFDSSTLWISGTPAYSSGVEENGEMIFAYGINQGTYENNRLQCTINRVVSEFDPLTETELILIDIGANASLAKGYFETRKFNVKKLNMAAEKKKLKKESFEGCTWTEMADQKEILKMIKTEAEDADAAKKIAKLVQKPGLIDMIALISDNDISCSQRYVWLYTVDGVKLELMYSQGD